MLARFGFLNNWIIFWKKNPLDQLIFIKLSMLQQTIGITMGSDCAPQLANMFICPYDADVF